MGDVTDTDAPAQPQREVGWDRKVLALHTRFEQAGISHAIGGAIAMNYHREPRSTLDVDINVFVAPERQAEVLAVLGSLFDVPDRQRVEQQLAHDGQSRAAWGSTYVDVFLATVPFHESMAQRVEQRPFGDVVIPVIAIEDLLICKALFGRPKDWVDVAAVVAAEGPQLDREYISVWLQQFLEPGDERIDRMTEALQREA